MLLPIHLQDLQNQKLTIPPHSLSLFFLLIEKRRKNVKLARKLPPHLSERVKILFCHFVYQNLHLLKAVLCIATLCVTTSDIDQLVPGQYTCFSKNIFVAYYLMEICISVFKQIDRVFFKDHFLSFCVCLKKRKEKYFVKHTGCPTIEFSLGE